MSILADRKTRILDINSKYVGTRPVGVRSESFLNAPVAVSVGPTVSRSPIITTTTVSPPHLLPGGSTVTKIGPVTTLGTLPGLITTPGSIHATPVLRTHTQTFETNTAGFDNGINTQPPADYWDTDMHESKRHKLKMGVKKAVGGCCERLHGFCDRFHHLCAPCCGCPWWVVALLAALTFGGLLAALLKSLGRGAANLQGQVGQVDLRTGGSVESGSTSGTYSGSTSSSGSTGSTSDDNGTTIDKKVLLTCSPEYFLHEGKCLSCPSESKWNGTHCIKTQLVNTTTTTITNSSGTFVVNSDNTTQPQQSHLGVEHLLGDDQ